MALPEYVVFSVNDAAQSVRYLSFTGAQKQLRFGPEEGVLSDTCKFAVEPASNGLVHLRSCYDNHYWVRSSVSEPWLSSSAPNPEEDETKEGCTLFRPELINGNNYVRFRHVKSGLNVVMGAAGDTDAYSLCVQQQGVATQFSYINHSSLVKLPKYILFKGDTARCLSARTIQNNAFLQFDSSSPEDPDIGFETFVTRNGNIRVKSLLSGKFWSLATLPNTAWQWILADYSPQSDPTNPNTMFEIVLPVATNSISLRCLGNGRFCKRLNADGIVGCLAAETDSENDQYARLNAINLGNPNKSMVTITTYRHPRVYDRKSEELVTNQVLDNPNDGYLFGYIRKNGHNHTVKHTFGNGVNHDPSTANFRGPVPFISEQGDVAIPETAVQLGHRGWGGPTDSSVMKDVVLRYPLPPRSRVTATLVAHTATCEVPFSYEVFDEFFGGGSATQALHDGVFTGEYTYATEVRIDSVEPLASASTQDSDATESVEASEAADQVNQAA